MELLNEMLSMPLFRNSLADWVIAVSVTVGLFFVLLTLRRLVRRYHQKLKLTEETELTEIPVGVLSRTTVLFFIVVSVFAGLGTLETGPTTRHVLDSALTIALFWQAGVWATAAAIAWLERRRRRTSPGDRAIAGSIGVIGFIAQVVIWSIVVLLTLENVGIDVTALVAGLGIGGIAVALAVQNILGDLFASLSITFDRPFEVGDFLIVGEFLGTVEYIGVKSTRLRSLSGEQIIMANADLLGSRVRNYGRMFERRVVFATGVVCETPPDVLERIPAIIRQIVEGQADTRFDRSHYAKRASFSVDFETVYYVLSPDFNKHMDIQQAINLKLDREFERLGIEYAYPTQRLLVETPKTERQDKAAA